ncbi:nucleolar protein 16-like [Quillaja saponaria]|uniref:Nucleolar protein 16 n=1 Tax=Quillaja saponaria TaxID=32244 RepID=A0AAD7Q168_QUISA|nr:nucleolar protein 16-like [Quillaja saponaria]
MGGSRRKYKKSRSKVQVGLPKKNPRLFKPAFNHPPKLLHSLVEKGTKWDDKGSVIHNYKSFGVVSNPNLLSVRSRTSYIIESDSLQVPPPRSVPTDENIADLDLIDSDLKSALGKKRRDGKSAPPQPLTSMQRFHISRLVDKYGDDFQRMFMDTKLNSMQHSVATLEKLRERYHMYKDKNPLILAKK